MKYYDNHKRRNKYWESSTKMEERGIVRWTTKYKKASKEESQEGFLAEMRKREEFYVKKIETNKKRKEKLKIEGIKKMTL